jgi:hypothetical protein
VIAATRKPSRDLACERARAALADLLGAPDADFDRLAKRILTKNQELYNRLA